MAATAPAITSLHNHIQGRKGEEGVVFFPSSVYFFFIRKQETFQQICLYVSLAKKETGKMRIWEKQMSTVLALAQSWFIFWD